MSELSIEQFADFFRALHDSDPFPWQTMLLRRVVEKGWPDLLDLPTASGKTACIDIAAFALALQSHFDWRDQTTPRTTPRRLFFVVDRRIVVDEAYTRAKRIADRLEKANRAEKRAEHLQQRFGNTASRRARIERALKSESLQLLMSVAKRLTKLSHTDVPVAVARLRGGVVPDNGWANFPTQPAIITGTVDQVGSRLLFRSYGCSFLVAPIHAALVAYDSLIILDEAHCAQPFRQTASAVCDYLDPGRWTTDNKAVAPPLRLMIMTATPPPGVAKDPFPADDAEREKALSHPKLLERRDAQKLAKLQLTKNKDFVPKAAQAVLDLLKANPNLRRIAVMVNRVQTARDVADGIKAIADKIETTIGAGPQIETLTGQLRPIDRDDLVGRLHDPLKSGSKTTLGKPIVLVTTQCLEVGADFDFDALVTECASLDALLQRFGRLDRLGTRKDTKAIILVNESDLAKDDDFVYGQALKATWNWLKSIATEGIVDFGIGAMHAHKRMLDDDKLKQMLTPASEAPVLMPAHVDLLCQTAPRPEPDPDVSVFLHGLDRARPEVFVAFRADLPADQPPADDEQWVQAIRLAPPLSSECLTVPLHRFQKVLRGELNEPDADVEAAKPEEQTPDAPIDMTSHFVVWRYGNSFATSDPRRVRPGDTIVFPAGPDLAKSFGITGVRIDRAEEAYWRSQRRVLLRIHPAVLADSLDSPAGDDLLSLFTTENELDDEEFRDSLARFVYEAESANSALATIAKWLNESPPVGLKDAARHPIDPNARIINLRRPQPKAPLPDLPDLDDENSTDPSLQQANSDESSLDYHTARVMQVTQEMSSAIPDFKPDLALSAYWHDAGKADDRFQFCLADGKPSPYLLAKSLHVVTKPRWQQLTQQSGLPKGFRHEMLSTQITAGLLGDTAETDLVLHLIASHHGHARPFAPMVLDESPPAVNGILLSDALTLDESSRAQSPPHVLDSGFADRFWRLTRRYGWWGLAYLESILRLSDWYASAIPRVLPTLAPPLAPPPIHVPVASGHELLLRGIDGGNLLGFLAALGTLRLLAGIEDEKFLLSWNIVGSAYRPVLHSQYSVDEDRLRQLITRAMPSADNHPVLSWRHLLGDKPIPNCRQLFDDARKSSAWNARFEADYLAALGSDLGRYEYEDCDTPLRAPRWDYLIEKKGGKPGNVPRILADATVEQIMRTLLSPWTYDDPLHDCSLKFDPAEDLRYALRWANPSGDPSRKKRGNMLGANRLAIEAIPLFVSITRSTDFATVACHRSDDGWDVTWPLWRPPLGLDTIRSLLASPFLADEADQRRELERGIAAVYQCRRETVGKTRIFTPARLLVSPASAAMVKGGAGHARAL